MNFGPWLAVALAAVAGGTAGCSGDASKPGLTVLAAASLQRPLTRLAADFERANPQIRIRLSFAGSDVLVAQVRAGAPADLLATADVRTMSVAATAQLISGTPTALAANRIVIGVARGNPHGVASLAGLNRPGIRVAICAPSVPCGALAADVAAAAGVTLHPVTLTRNVAAARGLVDSGEVDAALVYATEVHDDAVVTAVVLPSYGVKPNVAEVAVLRESANAAQARAFRDFLLTGPAQRVFAQLGFLPPP